MTTTLVKRPARTPPPHVERAELSIAEPPARSQKGGGAAGAGMIMMPVMSGVGSLTIAVTQRNNPIFVIAACLFLVGSIAVGVVMVVSQRSGSKRAEREGRERYLDYIEQLRHVIRDQIFSQRSEQAWRHPTSDQYVDIARDAGRRWERRVNHEDFLVLRVGTGTVPLSSGLTMTADTGPLNNFDPVCLESAKELQARYALLRDQPIVLDLRSVSQLSVLAEYGLGRGLATILALQTACLHSPNDVQIAVVRSDETGPAWEWVKWLPHNQHPAVLDGDLQARLVTNSVMEMQDLLAVEIEARLERHQRGRGGEATQAQHLVVFVDGEGLSSHQHLVSPDPSVSLAALGIHVVSLVRHQREEPEAIDDRIQIGPDGSMALASRPMPFTIEPLGAGVETVISRQLAPLRLTAEDEEDAINHTVGLPEILGVSDAARIPLGRTWRPRALRELLRVPIGIGSDGKVAMLDLKESAHGGMGPHGLVVGATGSGKSEMLRTLVSSLVIGHGPDRLALMLVDFKGGATFASMEHIPHIAGMITNLQDDLTLVDRMRDALFGEMQRRQEILKRAGNLPNVTSYQERIDAGEDLEPLPHLLVIVDEFSELLTAKPDFAELFVAIGRIGRSIGVHLLLASQKLEMGKIRGLESHLSYRIGLRTFSEGESRDAIGVPDAYHLPPEPGAGYLKVDTTIFQRFKAALVSAPYIPPAEAMKTTVPAVPYLAVNGLGGWLAAQSAAEAAEDDGAEVKKAGSSVLDLICRQLEDTRAPRVRPVWLDPLGGQLTLSDVVDPEERGEVATVGAALGIVDDAAKQRQFPLVWDFTGGGSNLVVTGSPATGKSVLLATMISSLSLKYAPGDVAFYCIDYGGGLLRNLEELPHVAAVATRVDPERIQRTINDVMMVLDAREELFRQHGLTSMRDLRKARAEGRVPADVPGDVFLVVDGWGTFRDEYDALEYVVGDIAARGQNYGVHVVLSVTQAMQVRMRMQASFGGKLELRLNDAFDSTFGRKMMEQITKEFPGRGLTDIDGELIFQTALPAVGVVTDSKDVAGAMPSLVAMVKGRWGDATVARVETLPELLTVDQLPPPEPGAALVSVGLSELNLGPAAVDLFGSSPHLMVLGDGETGKTNLLKVLIRGLMATRTPEQIGFVVVDYRRTLLEVVPEEYLLAYATSAEDATQVSAEICGALRERVPGKDVTPEQLRNRSWWKGLDVVVIADDFDLVSTSTGNPLQAFTELVPQGQDLGLHMILSRRTGGMSRAMFEPLMQRLADLSTPGLLFSGDRMEGRILNNVAATKLPLGRALYVSRGGGASQVQTALVPEEHTS